jgi:hypothetical protein
MIQASPSIHRQETGLAITSTCRRALPQPELQIGHVKETQATSEQTGTPLAAVASLRGPLARRNRAKFSDDKGNDTPVICKPTDIRYPHNAKRWRLGVGRSPGNLTTEGVFGMGKDTEDIVFTTGQLICPFRGHQQSTRPRQPNNQAWAHNGIREGTPGCLYINAYNNQDSSIRWLRMAGHEDLANGRIRCIPKQQGGGLGVYGCEAILPP